MQQMQSKEQLPPEAQQPQQEQAPQQGGGRPYPASPEEGFKFANNVMEELWRDGENSKWIKKLISMPGEMPIEQGIGLIAGQLVSEMLGQLRSSGRKPSMKIALGAVQRVIDELVEIGKVAGMQIPEGVEEPATAVATKLIDDTTNGVREAAGRVGAGGQQQQQQPQVPQQGV